MDAANPELALQPAREPSIFSAVVTPHRSLSASGFFVLMGIVVAAALLAGIVFFLLGAWPVLGFLGLGVVLIFMAFRANYRAAKAHETIDVSQAEVLVRRICARGIASEWRFNPRWVRFLVERDGDSDVQRLALRSHGREIEIAAWLSPWEKADFAAALSAALAAARTGHEAKPSQG